MKRSLPLLSAAWGLMLWAFLAVTGMPLVTPVERLFLFAPLVIVPLALHLLEPRDPRLSPLYAATITLQPLTALMTVQAFALAPGWAAGAWSAGWFLLTALVSLLGLGRWFTRGDSAAGEFFIDAGCLFLSFGGGWLVLSRLGIHPMGFSGDIVLLTAVHFHFAGLAASVFAGFLGRLLEDDPWRRSSFPLAAGVVSGIPLLAMGITFSPTVEAGAAGLLALSLAGLGALAVRRATRPQGGLAGRLLLGISGVSAWASMALALVYAWGEWTGRPTVDILFMARTHGALNAFGFSFCGLLAIALIPAAAPTAKKAL